jgi:RimJ/RimL family protein N-acetyltransferase
MPILRELDLSDAGAIYSALDRSRPALDRWMSWYHDTYRLEHADEWLLQTRSEREAGVSHHFGICEQDGGLVGVLGFEDIGRPDRSAMIGYWIATPSTGRGLGTAAIREALTWAREHLGVDMIWAIVATPNVASRRVLESNGFTYARDAEPTPHGDPQLIYELALTAREA